MRQFLSRALLVAAFAMITGMSLAGTNTFGPGGLPLDQADYTAMSTAADPLLNDDTVTLGTTRDWSNPNSGNHGTVTLLKRMEKSYQGSSLPCRRLAYHIVTAQSGGPYDLVLDRCKLNGEWKTY